MTVQKDGEEIARIDKNGRLHYPEKDRPDSQTRIPEVFMMRNENETVVSLPCDKEYYVTLETDKDCTISQYDLTVSPVKLVSEADKINLYRMAAGSYGFHIIPGQPIDVAPEVIKGKYTILGTSDYEYSAASVMNDELKAQGFLTIAGRISRDYLLQRTMGKESEEEAQQDGSL